MNEGSISIYFTYAHFSAKTSVTFRQRMDGIRKSVAQISGACLIEPKGDIRIIDCIENSDLFLAVMDEPSVLLDREIIRRCMCRKPFGLFRPKGFTIPVSIEEYIHQYRLPLERSAHTFNGAYHRVIARNMQLPMEYDEDEAIVHYVAEWVLTRGNMPPLYSPPTESAIVGASSLSLAAA